MESRPKVLVADDEAALRAALAMRLTHAGFDVVTVANGAAAIAAYDEQVFDAAVLDVRMPEIDGFGVCEHIRANRSEDGMPIFLLTGADDGILRDHLGALTHAVDGTRYLTKPCDGEGLARMLHRQLADRRAPACV